MIKKIKFLFLCLVISIFINGGPVMAEEKDIIDFCRETLAGFKLPKKVIFCDLPKTSTGKIQKFELRKKIKDQG